jgi:putative inorganic carbon (HCO3(-)) transporter
LAYGVLDDARFPLFFVVCTALALRDNWLRQHWRPLVLLPAALVVLFALLQIFVLPHNVLQHFGYGPNTIPIVQTVNSNAHYVRAQSTLRGANPLGAYLVLVIAILAALFLKSKAMRTKAIYGSSGLLTLIALYLTYSRGAWIGAALVLGACLLAVIKTKRTAEFVMLGVLLLAVVASVVTLSFRHNAHFENVIFHSSPHTVATTSDQNHSSALRAGIHDVIHDPLGRGPGTAGPASVYNYDRPARDPENYFVQIGQELGWLGLVLFILINVVLAQVLWQARREPLALALFASLIGISFVGLVSEVWTDDTLCYVWWGLAGIVMATQLQLPKLKAKL